MVGLFAVASMTVRVKLVINMGAAPVTGRPPINAIGALWLATGRINRGCALSRAVVVPTLPLSAAAVGILVVLLVASLSQAMIADVAEVVVTAGVVAHDHTRGNMVVSAVK